MLIYPRIRRQLRASWLKEVYMGKAGWIPIDVTIHETDYVDSGHIRLGILKTKVTVINFKEMTILDHTSG